MTITNALVIESMKRDVAALERKAAKARKLPDRDPRKEDLVHRYETELAAARVLLRERGAR